MKLYLLLIFTFFVNLQNLHSQISTDKWQALKELHTTMSQTFHPAEEGNLEPIKLRSDELMNKSAILLKTNIPSEFRSKDILAAAEKLQTQTILLDKLVKSNASDIEIMKAITDAHHSFHEIIGICEITAK